MKSQHNKEEKREIAESWKNVGTDFIVHYNEIARRFIDYIYTDKNDNMIFSPLSIIVLLSMLAGATAGNTRAEIVALLNDKLDYNDIRNQVHALLACLNISGDLKSANAACVDGEIRDSIKEDYAIELREFYDGELFSSMNAAKDTNRWISKKTEGAIQTLFQEPDCIISCLVNAVSFDAKWQDKYEDDDVQEGDFTNSDASLATVEMLQSEEKRYIESDKYIGFIKNYKRGDFSFMALLPKKKGSGNLRRCLNGIDFTQAFKSSEAEKVTVIMPEFSFSKNLDIKEFCKKEGIREAFTPEADFSSMSREWLKVEELIHSAKVEVDRKGTKAQAVTLAAIGYGCALDVFEKKIVDLDRPFIYAIMHNATKLPIFIGVVNNL